MKTNLQSNMRGAAIAAVVWAALGGFGIFAQSTATAPAVPATVATAPQPAPPAVAAITTPVAGPVTPLPPPMPAQLAIPPLITAPTGEGLRFQFRGAPLTQVLDYLSAAAGFTIVRVAPVEGTVDIVSHQTLDKEEAVLLLNTVLNQKGLAAVRSDRTLTIVSRDDARTRDLPIRIGSDPALIPKTDEVVTQIMPVKYANAGQLIQNLSPLLPQEATMTVNQSSNAILLTDTQTNIRRVAEIIKALDTQISGVSTIKVYTIKRSSARDMATVVNSVFGSQGGGGSSGFGSSSDPRRQMIESIMGGGRPGGGPGGGFPGFGGPGGGFPGFGGDRGGPGGRGGR